MTRPLPDPNDSGSARWGLDSRFDVREELGRGAHGVVYRARDRSQGGEVALKVVLGELTPVRRKRLAREARLVHELAHPGIVPLVAADLEAPRPWLAFRLIPGALTLADAWQPMPRAQRLDVLLEIAQALAYAHEQGVVHRDLKPENVLLEQGRLPRLADFGLGTDDRAERLTLSGAQVGTPWTMAPEQLHATAGGIGSPADVWALGVLLYLFLTDRRPFDAEDLVTLWTRVVSDDPVRPSRLVSDVDPGLEDLCLRALNKDPARRPPDARAFADALEERILAGLGAPARRSTPGLRVAAGILLCAALAATGLIVLQRGGARRPESEGPGPAVTPTLAGEAQPPATPATSVAGTALDAPAGTPRSWSLEELRQRAPRAPDAAYELGRRLVRGRGVAVDVEAGLRWLEQAAEGGHVGAMVEVGELHLMGELVPQDLPRAAAWTRRAGQAGDMTALTNYGILLAEGRGVPADERAAVALFRQAAEAGHAPAQRIFGFRLVRGAGVAKDVALGVTMLSQASAQGDPPALELLGRLYESGQGVARDMQEAERLYRGAAEGGRAGAMARLGDLLRKGVTGVVDLPTARQWLERGALMGDSECLYVLGQLEHGAGDLGRACELWRRAAAAGRVEAQRDLAICYMNGDGVPLDRVQAAALFRAAADAGDAQSMRGLGLLLRDGDGGPATVAEGAAWLRKAAETGLAEAITNYADCLLGGRGVARDRVEAQRWLLRGAEDGDPVCQRMLGAQLLEDGRDVEGATWMARAAEGGDPHACSNLSLLLRRGRGLARDPVRAHAMAQRAAEGGQPMGWVYLGDDAYEGSVAPADVSQALTYWRRAADQGEPLASVRLGRAYSPGGKAPTDREQARAWLEQARDSGVSGVEPLLRELER